MKRNELLALLREKDYSLYSQEKFIFEKIFHNRASFELEEQGEFCFITKTQKGIDTKYRFLIVRFNSQSLYRLNLPQLEVKNYD